MRQKVTVVASDTEGISITGVDKVFHVKMKENVSRFIIRVKNCLVMDDGVGGNVIGKVRRVRVFPDVNTKGFFKNKTQKSIDGGY